MALWVRLVGHRMSKGSMVWVGGSNGGLMLVRS